MISPDVAQNISEKLKRWVTNGPDYTSITFSKRGDSIRVKLEMNGSPEDVLRVVGIACSASSVAKSNNS